MGEWVWPASSRFHGHSDTSASVAKTPAAATGAMARRAQSIAWATSANIQTDREIGRQAGRKRARQRHKHDTYIQTNRYADIHTYIQIGRQTD